MTAAEQTALLKAVREMRRAQIAYFKLRSSEMLDEAKKCEREVDRMLRQLRSGETQGTMFDEEPR